MRIHWIALLTLLATDASSGAGVGPQRVLWGSDALKASIDLFVRRIGVSDTISVRQMVGVRYGDHARGQWRTFLPTGLSFISGMTEGEGDRAELSGVHEALFRCDRWGSFELRGSVFGAADSANWSSDESFIAFSVTPDTFALLEYGRVRFEYVVDGVHYRQDGPWWIPLDPGEALTKTARQAGAGEPPTVHAERAVRPMSSTDSSSVEVPVLVAVSRAGRVKDAQPYGLLRGVSEASKQAAVAAAWKWRFAPAMSEGQPISMIYVIKVPVSPTVVDPSEH